MLQLPLEEIRERFTWSEMVLLGWRSQEQSHNWKKRSKGLGKREHHEPAGDKRHYGADDSIPEGLPERFYDEEGSVNLSKVKGKEAVAYMNALGFKIPPIGGTSRG
jgi:hypothetical protein